MLLLPIAWLLAAKRCLVAHPDPALSPPREGYAGHPLQVRLDGGVGLWPHQGCCWQGHDAARRASPHVPLTTTFSPSCTAPSISMAPVCSALPTLCDQLLDGLSLTQTCSGMPVGLPRASTAPPGTSTNAAAPSGLQACVAGRASSVSYVDLSGPLGTHALACCAGLLGRELPPYQRHRHLHTRR